MTFGNFTRFAGLSPGIALAILAITTAVIIYGVIVFHPAPPSINRLKNAGEDLRCYQSIVTRMRAGEGYYQAAGDELRTRGYDTKSVFNWRLPTLAWILKSLPRTWTGRVLFITVAILSVLVWISVLGEQPHSFARLAFGSVVVLGPVIYGFLPDLFLHHDLWAGTLISLSLGAYARRLRSFSLAAGLLALFIRALALPFVCVMLAVAYLEGHRREALTWTAGVAAFCGFLLFHWSMVKGATPPGHPLGLEGGWLAFGGWPFVLSTARVHPYLFLLRPWVTAIALPLAGLGLAGWRSGTGARVALTVYMYVLAFLFVGRPYNPYWGMLYNGVMLLGLLFTGRSLWDLWRSARARSG